MNRKDQFKKGIGDKTRERDDDSKETVRKNREVKRYRSRIEQKHTQAFDNLVQLWNPQQFLNTNDLQQLDVLKTIVCMSTEDDMERYACKIIPPAHIGILVKRMTECNNVIVASLLAECIAGFTFHKTSHDKAYARAITGAGYMDVALFLLNNSTELTLRCNLWRPIMNIADTSPQAATDVLNSALMQLFPLEWQKYEAETSLSHILLSIAIVLLENLPKKPDVMLRMFWIRCISLCRFIQPVMSWTEDSDPIQHHYIYLLLKTLNLIFAKGFHYTARDDLFDSAPLEGYVKMLIHFANLRDAPDMVRVICYESLSELAITPKDSIPPILMGNGIVVCVMQGVETTQRTAAYQLMANLFSIGILVVKEFFDKNAVASIVNAIMRTSVSTRRTAIFALSMMIRMCHAELAHFEHKKLASNIMASIVVEHDAFKCILSMMNMNYGTQAIIDCLDTLECALKWDFNLAAVAIENHGIDDVVDQLVYFQNAPIAATATRISDLFHGRDSETRDMEYTLAASNLPFSF